MNLWDVNIYPHRIELTSKDFCESSYVLMRRPTPPHFTTVCSLFTTGLTPMDLCEGSPTLTHHPIPPHSSATWLPLYIDLSSILECFITHLPRLNCSCNSHTLGLFVLLNMSSPRSLPHPHSPYGNDVHSVRYVISSERILLDIITGVDEGILQEIPWESLPLTRVFVKERLALAAFFTYLCSTHAGVSLWFLNSGSGLSLSIDDQSFIVGNNSILGCNCSGWKEGAVGTLSCRNKKDCDSLLQELNTLKSVLGGFYVDE